MIKNLQEGNQPYFQEASSSLEASSSALSHVVVVGVGNVGSSVAYSLMFSGVARKITLIDCNKNKAEGEALDLRHCMQFVPFIEIAAGSSLSLVADAAVVIISAGKAQKPGQSRLDLLIDNARLYHEIIPQIVAINRSCIILVVTNPVDALTYIAWKLSGLFSCQVFGTGTVLDTARLRFLIGSSLHVSPKDISAYVLGEHGDSEFIWWSKAFIGGVPLRSFSCPENFEQDIYAQTKFAAYDIIEKKGTTNFAIALVICKIVKAIILNQHRVFTLSTCYDDVALSTPTIVRRNGVCQRLDIDLDQRELELYKRSREIVKDSINRALRAI